MTRAGGMLFYGVAALWTLSVLVGCTLLEGNTRKPIASPEDLHAEVQSFLTETERDSQAALALWDRIILREPVSCLEVLAVPDLLIVEEPERAAYPQVIPILVELNAAIQALRNAADLWAIECADERAFVPLAMAREGRAAAVSANTALASARALFDAWPVEASE